MSRQQAELLATQLQLLQHPSPLLRRQAVVGCFQLLTAANDIGSASSLDAIRHCLAQPYAEVVQEAALRLQQLAFLRRPGLDGHLAVQLLLDAIAAATSTTAPTLAASLVQVLPLLLEPPPADAACRGAAADGTLASPLPQWSQHPLSAALLSHRCTAPVLIQDSCRLLASAAARDPQESQLQATWQFLLEPFFSCLLLLLDCTGSSAAGSGFQHPAAHTAGSGLAGGSYLTIEREETPALASLLVWHLARVATSSEDVAQLVVPFLARHLAVRPCRGMQDGQLLVGACVDMIDLLDAHQPQPGRSAIDSSRWWASACQLVAQLLVQCALLFCSGPSSAAGIAEGAVGPCLLQLQRLLVLQPHCLPTCTCPALGSVLLALPLAQEQVQVLQIIAAVLQGPAQLQPWDAALLVLPLLQCIVLATTTPVRAWASKVLDMVQKQQQQQQQPAATSSGGAPAGAACAAGLLPSAGAASVSCVQDVLQGLWLQPCDQAAPNSTAPADCQPLEVTALVWCLSLQSQLAWLQQQQPRGRNRSLAGTRAPHAPAGDGAAAEAAGGAVQGPGAVLGLHGGVAGMGACWVLSGLLTHHQHEVVQAAAGAAQQLMLAHLPAAVPFAPVLLWQLRRLAAQRCAGAARAAQALLSVLPAMSADPTMAAIVQRATQTMTAPSAPCLLKAASLQLTVRGWQLTGRGWSRAEAAVNGCLRPGAAKPEVSQGDSAKDVQLALRLTRAKAVRDLAASGSGRVLDCICCLQECLLDPSCAVAALAMEAVALLTKDDTLSFYSAWQVVNDSRPPGQVLDAAGGNRGASGPLERGGTDPAAVQLACSMLDLLSCGAMDARAYADRAAAVLTLLWSVALQHRHPRVRAAALRSLAAFPLDLLEELEVLPPLQDYTQPLLQEAAALQDVVAAGGAAACEAAADHEAALRAAEQLALVAVQREFEQRRRFTAAAGPAGKAAASSRQGAGADSATKELMQMRHRVLTRLPQQLAVTAAGQHPSSAAPAPAHPTAAALLLLWQPRGGGGAAAQGLWQAVFEEVSTHAIPQAFEEPGLWAMAWLSFMTRWHSSSPHPVEPLLGQLRAMWTQGVPGQAVAACGAVAGLAAAGQLSEVQLTSVIDDLRLLLAQPRGTAVAGAAASALARMIGAVHAADWDTRRSICATLQHLLLNCTAPASSSSPGIYTAAAQQADEDGDGASQRTGIGAKLEAAAAAVEGLGHVGVALLQQLVEDEADLAPFQGGMAGASAEQLPLALRLACSCLQLLLSTLAACLPSVAGTVQAALLSQLPSDLPGPVTRQPDRSFWSQAHSQEPKSTALLMKRLWQATLSCAHALAFVTKSPALVAPLVTLVLQAWQSGPCDHPADDHLELLTATAVLPQAVAAGLVHAVLPATSLPVTLQSVLAMTSAALTTGNHRSAAAAAAASAQLVAVALPHGVASQQQVQQVLDLLVAVSAADGGSSLVGPSAGAAAPAPAPAPAGVRVAAVQGLALLLGVDVCAGTAGCWLGSASAADQPAATSSSSSSSLVLPAGSLLPLDSFSSAGAAPPPYLACAKSGLRQLEALAGVARKPTAAAGATIDQRVRAAAAWALAALARTAAAGAPAGVQHTPGAAATSSDGSSSAGDAGAVVPLSVYPSDGVLRPLAERVLQASSCTAAAAGQPSSAGPALGCSIIRVLAAGPRLPAAEWLPLCRRLLQPAPAASPSPALDLQLQQAVVQMVLAHGCTPGLNLSPALDLLLQPARFAQCHPAVQQLLLEQLLLEQLLVVLRALPIKRGPAVLTALPQLVRTAASPSCGDLGGRGVWEPPGAAPMVSAWRGLYALCHAIHSKDAQCPPHHHQALEEAVHVAVAGLVDQLPPLPSLPPGLLLQLLQAQQPAAAAHQGGSLGAAATSVAVWSAALQCLCRLRPPLLLQLAALGAAQRPPAAAFLRGVQLRALCVVRQALSWRDLAELWPALLQLQALDLDDDHQPWDALLPCVAAAACCLPHAAQLQLLQDIGNGAAMCKLSDIGAVLIAALAAAWGVGPVQGGPPHAAVVDAARQAPVMCQQHLAFTARQLLRSLPWTLPQLLRQPGWQGCVHALAAALQQLLQQRAANPVVPVVLATALVEVAKLLAPAERGASSVWQSISTSQCVGSPLSGVS